ncbi:hypothetical protein [Pseudonocardia sp. NPDC049154]|uniref:hypothetical protein n=1 Tax=Pseudonocardia sp. NPDC049154 TaxID=3155501 RepID=UPI003409AF8A
MSARRMHLNAFLLSSGHHEASWRYPASTPERMFDAAFYQDLARTAEAAAFDAIFLADIPKLDDNVEFNAAGGSTRSSSWHRWPRRPSGSG